MDKIKKEYSDMDMVIPVIYKGNVIAYSASNPNCSTFKFIDKEKGPTILYEEYGERSLTIVSIGQPNSDGVVTEITEWHVLDDEDMERQKQIKNG